MVASCLGRRPAVEVTYKRAELEAAWLNQIKNITWAIVGNEHIAYPKADILRMVKAVRFPFEYDPVKRNCSEFAEYLRYAVWQQFGWRGIGYVIDYDGLHCYNVALSIGPEFLLIEPQTGQFVGRGDLCRGSKHERYDMQRGVVIL